MNSLVTELQPAMLGLFLKGTIVLFVAAGATLLLRRGSASARYLIWSSSLVILVALPVLPTVLPSWNLPVEIYFLESNLNAETQEEDSRSASDGPQATLRGRVDGQGAGSVETIETNETNGDAAQTSPAQPPDEVGAPNTVGSTTVPSAAVARLGRANAIALGVWIAGSVAVLARLLFGFLGIWWIARRAKPVVDPQLLELTRDLSDDIGLTTPVRLLISNRSITPMTWGITWPAVLLPSDAAEWSDTRLRMILLHELAHVKRRDCLVQFVVWVACSLYWMNPLVWMAVRKMTIERERACDDIVLDSGFLGSDYAEHLLDIAKSLRAAPLSALTTVAMAHRSHFETRLLAILDPRLHRAAWGRVASTAFAITVVSGTVALATMQAGAPESVSPGAATSTERVPVGVLEPVRATDSPGRSP
jgi:beta-lactamase regulating signal transducer with metallopeptidase domain